MTELTAAIALRRRGSPGQPRRHLDCVDANAFIGQRTESACPRVDVSSGRGDTPVFGLRPPSKYRKVNIAENTTEDS
jgi:hypothetical protein